jgi:hypothetical protein
MSRSANVLQRLDRAVAFAVLGALLLTVVGTGEARAAVITPPEGDGDPMDDLVRQTGGGVGPAYCFGVYGTGKVVLDFGDVDLSVVDFSDDAIVDVDFGDAFDDYAGGGPTDFAVGADGPITIPDGQVGMGFIVGDTAACDTYMGEADPEVAASADDRDFPSFPFTITIAREDGDALVCTASVDAAVWLAGFDDADDDFLSAHLWTKDGHDDDFVNEDDLIANGVLPALIDQVDDQLASPVDCTTAPAVVAPVSMLALVCEPAVVSPGALVTCSVSGGDPGIEILWRASASPAFAGQGVRLDADGRGSFAFRVPETVTSGAVLVELVEWDRTATVVVSGSLVPTSVPAGEGMPSGRVALLGLLLLGVAGLLGRRTALEG